MELLQSKQGVHPFFLRCILAIFALGFTTGVFSQTTEIFTSSGNFTVPCGVTSITVEVYGGGGGGGGSNSGGLAGGGGGAGGYAQWTFAVSPGDMFPYVVGSGGVGGGPAGNGGPGTQSNWNGGVLFALGGTGGLAENNGGTGGAGGNASAWAINATGGTGGNGGAVLGGIGGTAGGPNGGGGGPGGTGGINGATGSNYGGGGGGGGDKDGAFTTSGGAGASGAVIVSYTSTVTLPNAGSDQNACGALSLTGNTPDAGWTGTWSVIAGSATIADVNNPTSGVGGIAAGSCATLRWTFTLAGCTPQFDDVVICVPTVCNDDPCNAQPIAVGTSCSYNTYSNVGATVTTGTYEPACGSFSATASEDVWFSATVPANGVLNIQALDAAGGSTFYPGIAIYSGPCTDMMHQGCDQTTSGITPSSLVYTGTPGETVYIRVWDYLDNTGSFDLCAFTHTNPTADILTGSTTITCGTSSTFMDPGGTGDYSNEMTAFYTICPDTPGEYVSVNFTSFNLETNFDFLTVMDGGGTFDSIIGNYTGTTLPPTITSSNPDGCLTFMFRSDNIGTAAGWLADVTCTSTPGVNTPICTSTNCAGECGQWICQDGLYPTENQGSASVEEITYQSGGCWLGAGEISTKWFYFQALTAGTIEITFNGPAGQDYDLAVWGPSYGEPACPSNTGDAPIRCSYSAASNPVGIGNGATDLYEDAGGDGWVAPLNVVPGEIYVLALNIFQNGNPQPTIDITFGGTGTLDCTPVFLPVSLTSFYAVNQGDKNIVTWVTESEINSDYFLVQRSVDGMHWEVIGSVDAAGNSSKQIMYNLEDKNPFFPVTYYRLKQVDNDGEYEYSEVISVNAERITSDAIVSTIFPNPANDYVTFAFQRSASEMPLNVQIVDKLGNVISDYSYSKLVKGMPVTLRTSNLDQGMYQVVFSFGDEVLTQKLSIIR